MLRDGLREFGWIEGKNLAFEDRSADDDRNRLPVLAAELVSLDVDVIVGLGTLAPLAAKWATSTIPIIMAAAGKQPGRSGRHPALLARDAPPFMQYLKQDGRENDVSILLAPRLGEGRLLPCSTRMSIRSRSISVSLSDTTSEARRPVA